MASLEIVCESCGETIAPDKMKSAVQVDGDYFCAVCARQILGKESPADFVEKVGGGAEELAVQDDPGAGEPATHGPGFRARHARDVRAGRSGIKKRHLPSAAPVRGPAPKKNRAPEPVAPPRVEKRISTRDKGVSTRHREANRKSTRESTRESTRTGASRRTAPVGKKNPVMLYAGIGGGALVLLIVIIAVASSGSSSKPKEPKLAAPVPVQTNKQEGYRPALPSVNIPNTKRSDYRNVILGLRAKAKAARDRGNEDEAQDCEAQIFRIKSSLPFNSPEAGL